MTYNYLSVLVIKNSLEVFLIYSFKDLSLIKKDFISDLLSLGNFSLLDHENYNAYEPFCSSILMKKILIAFNYIFIY